MAYNVNKTGKQSKKYVITIVGIICVMLLSITALILSAISVGSAPSIASIITIAIGGLCGLIATYLTGQSAVEFKSFSKNENTVETINEKKEHLYREEHINVQSRAKDYSED